MRYSLEGLNSIHAIKQYVLKGMHEMKLGPCEIFEFKKQVDKYDYDYAVQVAQDYIEELNRLSMVNKV